MGQNNSYLLRDPGFMDLLGTLNETGQQALESGAISPADAKKHLVEGENWLTNFLKGPQKASGPLDMTVGLEPASGPLVPRAPASAPPRAAPLSQLPVAPGFTPGGRTAKSESKGQVDNTQSRNSYEGASDVINQARNLPEVQDAARSTSQMEDVVNMMQASRDPNSYWVKPLLALSDSVTGSKLSGAYQDPAGKFDTILKYRDEINKRKQDMAKTLIDSISKMKTGQDQNKQMQMLMMGMGGAGAQLSNSRLNTLTKTIGEAFDKDKILEPLQANLNSMGRAESLLRGDAPIDIAAYNQATTDYLKGLQGNQQLTEGMATRENPHNLELDINKLKSYFKPGQDMRKDADGQIMIKNLLTKMSMIREDYAQAGHDRATKLGSSYQDIPEEQVQSTIARKIKEWEGPKLYTSPKAAFGAKPKKVAAPVKKAAEMTDAELDAELAKQGS